MVNISSLAVAGMEDVDAHGPVDEIFFKLDRVLGRGQERQEQHQSQDGFFHAFLRVQIKMIARRERGSKERGRRPFAFQRAKLLKFSAQLIFSGKA